MISATEKRHVLWCSSKHILKFFSTHHTHPISRRRKAQLVFNYLWVIRFFRSAILTYDERKRDERKWKSAEKKRELSLGNKFLLSASHFSLNLSTEAGMMEMRGRVKKKEKKDDVRPLKSTDFSFLRLSYMWHTREKKKRTDENVK